MKQKDANLDDFVLETSIFSNVFEKDIRKVFIYKKAERLAKAIHLIAPAFAESASLKNRADEIAIGLVDAAVVPSSAARAALARELLALSSVLSMARVGGLLSPMNAELIAREAHALLQEVAAYEEPRLIIEDTPTLAGVAKRVSAQKASEAVSRRDSPPPSPPTPRRVPGAYKGQKDNDTSRVKDRREAIMSAIRNKGQANIKDISTSMRDVSEKTVQRELAALISDGLVRREGERRWSTYSLA